MNCSCGNATVSVRNKRCSASLAYERCGACGRCGGFVLRVDGTRAASGEMARRLFQDEAALSADKVQVATFNEGDGGYEL